MSLEAELLISVVMPAYQAERTIALTIESVLAQTYRNLELIVIDDCSKDGTSAIVERYASADCRIRMLTNGENRGVSDTRMRGVEVARSEWIAFLDSDDAWMPDKLEKQMAIQQKYNAQLVFTGSCFMNADGEPLDWILHVPERIGYRHLLKQNVISNSSVLLSRDVYLRCAVRERNLHEDFACWLNFLKEGNDAYGIDLPLLRYRISATSKSGNKWKAAKMNWNTYRAVGLGIEQATYYMGWYTVRGLLKYSNLKRGRSHE